MRLTAVLQNHTAHDVRLADARRYEFESESGWFNYDLVYTEQQEEVLELAAKAHIIHLHNCLDLDSTDFAPLNFRRLQRQGKRVIRQFHSPPQVIASRMGVAISDVMGDPLPSLVIAQYPERFYPKARVVPNILPHNDPAYLPLNVDSDGEPDTDIVFSANSMTGAWEDRWNTKGAPETLEVMNRVSELTGCTVALLRNMPLSEILERRRRARIVITDLVGGSYHLSGLEGVCMGKPVLAYMDNRTDFVLREISGASESPFLNVRLEDAVEVLAHLVEHPQECEAVGKAARTWMETYWRDDLLAGHYNHVYNRLFEDPSNVTRQRALALDTPDAHFKCRTLPELLYESRKANYKWR